MIQKAPIESAFGKLNSQMKLTPLSHIMYKKQNNHKYTNPEIKRAKQREQKQKKKEEEKKKK